MAGDPPEGWVPAFAGQRPPLTGMEQLKHGAYSAAKVDPVAQQYVDALLADDDVAYLRKPSFLPAVYAWARAEARVQLLTDWVADRPPVEGKPLPALEQLRQWESTAAKARDRLGLNPIAQARLRKDMAVTGALSGARHGLGALAERGRQARLSAEERRTLEVVPDPDEGVSA